MLGREPELLDLAPVLVQEVAVPTRDQVDDVLGVLGQLGDRLVRQLCRDRVVRVLDDRGQGALEEAYREREGGAESAPFAVEEATGSGQLTS